MSMQASWHSYAIRAGARNWGQLGLCSSQQVALRDPRQPFGQGGAAWRAECNWQRAVNGRAAATLMDL